MTSGIARRRVRTTTVTTDEVTQDGGHSPANRLTDTCVLVCLESLSLDINVMVILCILRALRLFKLKTEGQTKKQKTSLSKFLPILG